MPNPKLYRVVSQLACEKDPERVIDFAAELARLLVSDPQNALQLRAQEFADKVGANSEFDRSRKAAYDEVMDALAKFKAEDGTLGDSVVWAEEGRILVPWSDDDPEGLLRWVKYREIRISVSKIEQFLGDSTGLAWDLPSAFAFVESLLKLDSPLPQTQKLAAFRDQFWQLLLREKQDQVWGCWLIMECKRAMDEDRDSYLGLARKVGGGFTSAIQAAARQAWPSRDNPNDEKDNSDDRTVSTGDGTKQRATLSFAGGKPKILYNKKEVVLKSGQQMALLINFLYQCKISEIPPTYKGIFEAIYPNDSKGYRPDARGAPPEKLRQAISRLNRQLKDKLPRLPGKCHNWIIPDKGNGVHLTGTVEWQAMTEWKEREWYPRNLSSEPHDPSDE